MTTDKTTNKKKNWIAGVLIVVALLLAGWQWINYNVLQGRGRLAQRVSGLQIFAAADAPTRERIVNSIAEQMLHGMMDELNLSLQQQQQIRAVQTQAIAQGRKISEDPSLSEEQKREQIRQLRTKTLERINDTLTPEQQLRFSSMRTKAETTLEEQTQGFYRGAR